MAGTRKAAAEVRPGEGSPTPAEVYRAALLDGRTEAEATELSEARAVELAGGTPGAAGGTVTIDDVPDDADDASAWLNMINDLVNAKHPGAGWQTADTLANGGRLSGDVAPLEKPGVAEPEAWDPEHCPTPLTCFPYGAGDGTATCIHGTSTRAPRTS
jgi:hypothetical protein